MNIGYDIDGVVVEIMKPMVRFLGKSGIDVPPYEETHDHNLIKIWGCSPQEVSDRIGLFYASPDFDSLAGNNNTSISW